MNVAKNMCVRPNVFNCGAEIHAASILRHHSRRSDLIDCITVAVSGPVSDEDVRIIWDTIPMFLDVFSTITIESETHKKLVSRGLL
ncbi:MAG: hypothetical protein EBU84_16900, partial [Actinobacteria bacterium]|nr:hypothetical protein [Actinomycetota bacterium]